MSENNPNEPRKVCIDCGEEQPLSQFGKHSNTRDGHRGYCKQCHVARNHVWVKLNPESVKAASRRYRQKHANQLLAAKREWRRKRPKAVRPTTGSLVIDEVERERRRESARAYARMDYQKHRERYIANAHKRKARIRSCGGSYAPKEWRDLLDEFHHQCVRCGIHESDTKIGKLTPDHVQPISDGGSNTIDNIQPMCLPCNIWKSNKIEEPAGMRWETYDYRPLPASMMLELTEMPCPNSD